MGSSAKDPKLQLGTLKLTTSEDFKQVRDRIMLFVFSNAPQLDRDAIKRVNAALIDTIVALVDPATPNGKLMMAMMSSALKDPKKMTVWQDHSPASTTELPDTDRAKIGWAAGVPISRPLYMLLAFWADTLGCLDQGPQRAHAALVGVLSLERGNKCQSCYPLSLPLLLSPFPLPSFS